MGERNGTEKRGRRKKMTLLMPVIPFGTSLSGGLSRKLRQCSVAIFRPDCRGVPLVQQAQLAVGSGQKNKREKLEINHRR